MKFENVVTAFNGNLLHRIQYLAIAVMLDWWAIRHLYTLLFAGH